MTAPIVGRWEWRTFIDGTSFGESEKKIEGYESAGTKSTEEVYILSKKSDENIKFRFDLIDVKALQNVNSDKLEQWLPVLKSPFPIESKTLTELFAIFKVSAPEFNRAEYTYEQFLEELIKPNPDLRIVGVKKTRNAYKVDGATTEIATTEFDGKPWRTICVEHEDAALVIGTVRKLGLENLPNINYIQAMKKSVGLIK